MTKYYNPDLKDAQDYSSLDVEKASFVKLDNATLGYTFNVSKSNVIKSLRAYVNGQNLFVITNYTGVDPEVRYDDSGNILAPGIDRRETWVRTRLFSFGVNLTF
jgi:iron complex outermembrane receptor protein